MDLKLEIHQIELRTLSDLLAGGQTLYVECLNCDWLKGLDLPAVMAQFGTDLALRTLRLKVRCDRCRSSHVRLLLFDALKRGDRAWQPSPPRTRRD